MGSLPRVAFFGIGRMGSAMAPRLLAAGYPLAAWNRTAEKAAPLAEAGATVASTVAEAAADARVAITMLQDAAAVEGVLFDRGLVEALPPGATVVDMSSIPPATAREHGRRAAAAGVGYLDAPVSGGTGGAAAGELAIMVGGEPGRLEAVRPVLEVLGTPIRVGPLGAGQTAKCVNQAIVGVTIGAVAEGLLLARREGLDLAALQRAIAGGFADSRILREHGRRMIDRDFTAGAPIRGQLKDMKTLLGVAPDLDLPLSTLTLSLYESLSASGAAELDHSALLLELEHRSATDPGRDG